jgi:hypothetical protein
MGKRGVSFWLKDVRVKVFLGFAAFVLAFTIFFSLASPPPPLIIVKQGKYYFCGGNRLTGPICVPISEKERRHMLENYRP